MKTKRLKNILNSDLNIPGEVEQRFSDTLVLLGADHTQTVTKPTVNLHLVRRIILVAIIILTITTTAFAAARYLGAFDKLREVIGDEKADQLQPLEISNIPAQNATKDARLNDGDAAVGIIAEDTVEADGSENDSTTWNGIRVELIAVGVFDNVVDIYVTLEDLVGDRLSGDFTVEHHISPVVETGLELGSVSSIDPDIISRTDEGVVTIRKREIFDHSVVGLDLTYSLKGLNFDMLRYTDDEINVEFDLTLVKNQPSVLFISENPRGGRGDHDEYMAFRELMKTEGMNVLHPHLHDIELGLFGIETRISSIGIIDDRLHIQTYEPSPDWSKSSHVWFNDQQSQYIYCVSYVEFDVDEEGNLYNPETVARNPAPSQYKEWIFDIDLDNISEYTLSGEYESSSFLPLDWSITFEVEKYNTQIVADGLDISYNGSVITEVRISSAHLFVMIKDAHGDLSADDILLSPPGIVIHTENKAVQIPITSANIVSGSNSDGTFFRNLFYDISEYPLDLNLITSIEIAGEDIKVTAGLTD